MQPLARAATPVPVLMRTAFATTSARVERTCEDFVSACFAPFACVNIASVCAQHVKLLVGRQKAQERPFLFATPPYLRHDSAADRRPHRPLCATRSDQWFMNLPHCGCARRRSRRRVAASGRTPRRRRKSLSAREVTSDSVVLPCHCATRPLRSLRSRSR